MMRAFAELTQDQQYTRKATQQAIASGMNPTAAKKLVNRNANTKTRTTGRASYVNRVL